MNSRLPVSDTVAEYVGFFDWPGSLMNDNYSVIYDLVVSTWEWGVHQQDEATQKGRLMDRMICEFDPSIIQDCFQPWYFNQTATGEAIPPTWERFPEKAARMVGEPPVRIIRTHRKFLMALLYEKVWIPGRYNRAHHREMDSTLAVTEMLYLLRMVSGASSYLAEVDDVPEPCMFYN